MSDDKQKPEGVRAWYERTTKRYRRISAVVSLVIAAVMALTWTFASTSTLMKIQSFNGALTIPLVAGLWIFMFIFMFLVPSREASFRGQEALDQGIELLRGAAEVWKDVGLKVQTDMPIMMGKVNAVIDELKVTARCIEDAAKKNENFIEGAKPALEALKRIEDGIEREMKSGIVEDIRMAIDAVKMMMPPPTAQGGARPTGSASTESVSTPPADLSNVLKVIGKKKESVQAPAVKA